MIDCCSLCRLCASCCDYYLRSYVYAPARACIYRVPLTQSWTLCLLSRLMIIFGVLRPCFRMRRSLPLMSCSKRSTCTSGTMYFLLTRMKDLGLSTSAMAVSVMLMSNDEPSCSTKYVHLFSDTMYLTSDVVMTRSPLNVLTQKRSR